MSSSLHPWIFLLTIHLLTIPVASDYAVQLKELSTIYIPTGYAENGTKLFQWNGISTVKVAVDRASNIVYVASDSYLHFYHLDDPENPVEIARNKNEAGYYYVDIKICGEQIFTLSVNTAERISYCGNYATYKLGREYPGRLGRRPGFKINDIARSLYVTSDCKTLVITTKGEAYGTDQLFRDPNPSLVVLHRPDNTNFVTEDMLQKMLIFNNFQELNNRSKELTDAGLRFVMEDHDVELSQDLDPADITVDEQAGKIYITLQVNNAIAEFDLKSARLNRISALGFKDWRNLVIDTSNQEKSINFSSYPIYSYYLPSSMKLLRQKNLNQHINKDDYMYRFLPRDDNEVYLVTTDQGADRDYSNNINWTEIITGQEMVENNLLPATVEPRLRADLANLSRLGGMEFTKKNGQDMAEVNGFRRFVVLGGRGFSVWRLRDFQHLYDSGDSMEKRHAQFYPRLFNCKVQNEDGQIFWLRDEQSPQKGLEPSVIEIGGDKNLTLLFVGSKHPGTVSVYSILNDVTDIRFEYLWTGIPRDYPYRTWGEAYKQRRISGVTVTDIIFIPSDGFRVKRPLVLVGGSSSGTLTVFEVDVRGTVPGSDSKDNANAYGGTTELMLLIVLLSMELVL